MPRATPDLRTLRPQRLCLIKPSALGDIVNALPVLSALRQRWPDAWIAWVVNHSFRGLLEGHPELDQVIVYDRVGAKPTPAGAARVLGFLGELRQGGFDLAIDLQGLLRSGIMALATRARVRVGLADAREGAARFYTHRVSPPEDAASTHAVERLLRVVHACGADVSNPKFAVPLGDEERRWARAMLANVPIPRLILNVGASWKTKRWPPEHFAEIGRRAARTHGAGLVAIGSLADSSLVEEVRRRLEPTPLLDLCGRTTLRQLAALTAEADLVLSNDTGPLHLASAAGARVLGIFTCTNPERHGPYGPDAATLQANVWCAGSYLRHCARLDCMRELDPDRVWPLVQTRLEATRLATVPGGGTAG